MRACRGRSWLVLLLVLGGGAVSGCGDDGGDERRSGVSREQAEAVAGRLVCPGEEARVECTPASDGWSCVYGAERKTILVTESDPETGRLC